MIKVFRTKRPAEIRWAAVDFSDRLQADEQLSGTPTVIEVDSAALTISEVEINTTADIVVNMEASKAYHAVSFLVAGGTAGNEYKVRVTVDTDEGQTLIREISFRVN